MLSGASKPNANANACRQGGGGRVGTALQHLDVWLRPHDSAEARGCSSAQTMPMCKHVSSSLLIYRKAKGNSWCYPPTRSRAVPPKQLCGLENGLENYLREQSLLSPSSFNMACTRATNGFAIGMPGVAAPVKAWRCVT
eukprot:6185559-Pleurochrysis_carterae.AAC.3